MSHCTPRPHAIVGLRSASRIALVALVASVLLLATSSTSFAGAWKGEEVTMDGVVHVKNPAKGMEKPTEVNLKELWRLGGDSENEDEFFGVIAQIATDSQANVYLLDMQLSEIKVFSPTGEYLRTIGREGEGPGEFRRPADMFFLPDGNLGVMQTVPGKIIKLTPDGDPADEFAIPQPPGGGFQILHAGKRAGNNVALVRRIQSFDQESGKIDMKFTIDLVNSSGELISTLEEKAANMTMANLVIDEQMFDSFERRTKVGDDGRIYAATNRDDYTVKVWSPDGKLERVITRDYEHYKRTTEEFKKVEERWTAFTRRAPNSTLKISQFDKDILDLHARDDGTLWVHTSHGGRNLDDGVLGSFDVFDSKGRYVRTVSLKGQGNPREDGYFFVNDRLYVVTGFMDALVAMQGGGESDEDVEEEDPTPMEIICYRVESPVVATGGE